MVELNNIRESIASAGRLQEMIDRILICGVVPRWLPLSAACFYAGLGEKKMLSHVLRGNIYGTLIGGKWLIDRLSIDEFMLDKKRKVENILENLNRKR